MKRSIKPQKGKQDITDELFEIAVGKEVSICSGEEVNEFIQKFIPWTDHTLNKILFLTDDVVKEISTGQKDLFKSLKELLSFEEVKNYLNELSTNLNSLKKEIEVYGKKLKDFSESNTDLDTEKVTFERKIKE